MNHIKRCTLPRRAQEGDGDGSTPASGIGFLDVLEQFFPFLLILLQFKTQETGTPTA